MQFKGSPTDKVEIDFASEGNVKKLSVRGKPPAERCACQGRFLFAVGFVCFRRKARFISACEGFSPAVDAICMRKLLFDLGKCLWRSVDLHAIKRYLWLSRWKTGGQVGMVVEFL